MFLEYFKMNAQPFGVTPDPRFLYLSQSHREALASLYHAVESDRGFVALIAPPGLGKTTLIFQLLEKLQHASRTVFLFQTQCNSRELFHYLLNALGVDASGMGLVTMHNKLNEILCREMLAGRRFVLAIDEAQNLDTEVLETIRLLSNFETAEAKLLQIVLIGQPRLARKLASPELEQLRQRISAFASLEPLCPDDAARYIAHRLEVAGYAGDPLFTPQALLALAERSQGVPRAINGLCFAALSLACAMGRKQVDGAMMLEVVADREVESMYRPNVTRAAAPVPPPARPVLSIAGAKARQSASRWVLGAGVAAMCAVLALGMHSLISGRIVPPLQKSWEAVASLRDSAALLRGFVAMKSEAAPHPSARNVPSADIPAPESGPLAPAAESERIKTVVVQPGDTLRQISLRDIGAYDSGTIEKIRKLNPSLTNLNYLEAGQRIRLPRAAVPLASLDAGEATVTLGKN